MENDALARLNVHGEPARDLIEDLPAAYVEFNAQGMITYANSIARSLHSNKVMI
jgi:PAS domain-containing protein